MRKLLFLLMAMFIVGCASKPGRGYFPEGSLTPRDAQYLANTFAKAGEPPLHKYVDSGKSRYRFVFRPSTPQIIVSVTVIDSGFGQVLRSRIFHVGGSCLYDQSRIMKPEEFKSFVSHVESLEDSSLDGLNPEVWSLFMVLDGWSYYLETWAKDDTGKPGTFRVYEIADPSYIEFSPQTHELLRQFFPESEPDVTEMGKYVNAFRELIEYMEAMNLY